MSGTAASFVTASLETAGLITQAEFLDAFQKLFSSGGALFATIAAFGALISVAVFGSAKMWRYLFVGPAVFWFLLAPRTDAEGTIWRLGAHGTPRTPNAYASESEALAVVHAVTAKDTAENLNNAKENQAETPDPIRISSAFKVYIDLIDGIIGNFVSLIIGIQDQDQQVLINLNRARMMEEILRAKSDSPEFANMLQGDFLAQCHPYLGAVSENSNHRFSDENIDQVQKRIDSLSGTAKTAYQQALDSVKAEKDATIAEIERLRKYEMMVPNEETFRYVKLNAENSQTLKSALQKYSDVSPSVENVINNNTLLQDKTIPCGAMWEIAKDAITKEAEWFVKKMQLRYVPPELTELAENGGLTGDKRKAAERRLCEAILEKLSAEDYTGQTSTEAGEAGLGCDLTRVASIFLLRNIIAGNDQAKTIQRMKNRMGLAGTIPKGIYAARPDAVDWEYKEELNPNGYTMINQEVEGPDGQTRTIPRNAAVFENRKTGERSTIQAYELEKVGGPLYAGYVEQQRVQTRDLRQRIYTFAMQLPYWQGVMLFITAALYPFVCFIVLLPNRAMGMMTYALTWLWLKSWDIGFAAVMLLDSVLWNIFPKTDFARKIEGQDFADIKFEDMVEEALRVDPTYNLHAYYMMVSMAMFAIPALSGAVILKGKKSFLSSFTTGMTSAAEDGGRRATSRYQGNISHLNSTKQMYLNAHALAPFNAGYYKGWQNALTNHNDPQAMRLAVAKQLSANASSLVKGGKSGLGKLSDNGAWLAFQNSISGGSANNFVDKAMGSVSGGLEGLKKLFDASLAADIAYDAHYNPIYGRASARGIALESLANATSPEGGYELAHRIGGGEAAEKGFIDLFGQKLSISNDILNDLLKSLVMDLGGAATNKGTLEATRRAGPLVARVGRVTSAPVIGDAGTLALDNIGGLAALNRDSVEDFFGGLALSTATTITGEPTGDDTRSAILKYCLGVNQDCFDALKDSRDPYAYYKYFHNLGQVTMDVTGEEYSPLMTESSLNGTWNPIDAINGNSLFLPGDK